MVMMLITDQPANRTTLRLTETTHKELNDKDQDEDNQDDGDHGDYGDDADDGGEDGGGDDDEEYDKPLYD